MVDDVAVFLVLLDFLVEDLGFSCDCYSGGLRSDGKKKCVKIPAKRASKSAVSLVSIACRLRILVGAQNSGLAFHL